MTASDISQTICLHRFFFQRSFETCYGSVAEYNWLPIGMSGFDFFWKPHIYFLHLPGHWGWCQFFLMLSHSDLQCMFSPLLGKYKLSTTCGVYLCTMAHGIQACATRVCKEALNDMRNEIFMLFIRWQDRHICQTLLNLPYYFRPTLWWGGEEHLDVGG